MRSAVRVRSSALSLTDKGQDSKGSQGSVVVSRRLTPAHSRCTGSPATGLLQSSLALPLLALVHRELRLPHTPTGEHPRGGRDCGGEDFEYPTDVWLSGGFEDDYGNRPFGPLLVAGVALEDRDDLGPELGPLLFGSDAGDPSSTPVRRPQPATSGNANRRNPLVHAVFCST